MKIQAFLKRFVLLTMGVLIVTACSIEKGSDPSEDKVTSTKNNETHPSESSKSKQVYLYFSDHDLMEMYGEKREITGTEEADLPKVAVETWIEGPEHKDLKSILPEGVAVESVTIEGDTATIIFSKELKNANLGSGGEAFLLDQIALIMQQFGAEKTQVLIEGKKEETLLGHIDLSEPYPSPDPDQYQIKED